MEIVSRTGYAPEQVGLCAVGSAACHWVCMALDIEPVINCVLMDASVSQIHLEKPPRRPTTFQLLGSGYPHPFHQANERWVQAATMRLMPAFVDELVSLRRVVVVAGLGGVTASACAPIVVSVATRQVPIRPSWSQHHSARMAASTKPCSACTEAARASPQSHATNRFPRYRNVH